MPNVAELYHMPLFELMHEAMAVHRKYWQKPEIRICGLYSVKTGACTEDCSYCAQSARYQTGVQVQQLADLDLVFEAAVEAKSRGVTHFCLSAAWREIKSGKNLDRLIEMFQSIQGLGLRLCANLGMASVEVLSQLRAAGVEFYNHNLDTSPEYYPQIVGAHTFADRLQTLENLHEVQINACVGMILGLGESVQDRIRLLEELLKLEQKPSSIPVNVLVPIPGTPLAENARPTIWEVLRMIAVLRIVFPGVWIPLAAGRREMSQLEQCMCLLVGANSLFAGEKLLTTALPGQGELSELLQLMGLEMMPQLA